MSWLGRFLLHQRAEQRLDAELRFHYDARVAENIRLGMSESAARRAARLEFGGLEQVKEECRDQRRLQFLHSLARDLRFAVRGMRRAPGFTLVAVMTLALGIGATTLIFSIVNAELLRPLPFADPGRLMQVAEKNDKLNLPVFSSSVLNYLSWREQSRSFEAFGAIASSSYALTGRGDPEQFSGYQVTPSLFPLLGIHPIAGRAFIEGEDKPGSPPVAMLGEALWKRRFGADPSLIGRRLNLNGNQTTVVGIAPTSLLLLANGDILTPLTIDPGRELRLSHLITTVGRLRPGVTVAQSQAEMDTVFSRIAAQHPEIKDWGIRLIPFSRWFVTDDLRKALQVLMGLVVFVLLIASANIANLMLARNAARQREFAVRNALGATRAMLGRQLLTESVLLSLAGGAAGLICAVAGLQFLNRILPPDVLPIRNLALDSSVLLFAVALTIATGLFFGTVPALVIAAGDLSSAMKQGGRSSTGGHAFLRNSLVAAELALATCLLICAGILLQNLLHLEGVPLGFPPEKLLTFQVAPPKTRYPDNAHAWAFYHRMLVAIDAIPGVHSSAVSSGIPFGAGTYATTPMTAPGESSLPPGDAAPIDWRAISPGYFHTMSIPLLSGRDFTLQDGPNSLQVAVISREGAHRLWGTRDPIGRIVRVVGSGKEYTVIGVVGDARNTALNQRPGPAIYLPAAVRSFPTMDVVVHTAGPPESVLREVSAAIRNLDPELPIGTVRTMESWVHDNAAQPRLNASLVGYFAFLALTIAAIGIYGVLSYTVNLRTREIGVRMALGARPSSVVLLILRQGMTVSLAGIVVGILGALAFGKLLQSLVYEIQVRDPVIYIIAASLLAAASVIACHVPAQRAARVDPIVALRED